MAIDDTPSFSDGGLACPNCGGLYLHHVKTHVFFRGEDSPTVNKTSVGNGMAEMSMVDDAESGNPSPRRDGVVVEFECEDCHSRKGKPKFKLSIYQHKGCTYIEWL